MLPDFIAEVKLLVGSRFQVVTTDAIIEQIEAARPAQIMGKALRLRRLSNPGTTWKTVLATIIPDGVSVTQALHWVREVKGRLPEPESTDLYLLILQSDLDHYAAYQIESDDFLCRKQVRRSNEPFREFIERTFIADISNVSAIASIVDPLNEALAKTVRTSNWMSPEQAQDWKRILMEEDPDQLMEHLLSASENTRSETE